MNFNIEYILINGIRQASIDSTINAMCNKLEAGLWSKRATIEQREARIKFDFLTQQGLR